jgi:hypothetical protein
MSTAWDVARFVQARAYGHAPISWQTNEQPNSIYGTARPGELVCCDWRDIDGHLTEISIQQYNYRWDSRLAKWVLVQPQQWTIYM